MLHIEPDDTGKIALEVRISRLKKKMHEAGVPDLAIKSLWKEGYQLCMPVQIVPCTVVYDRQSAQTVGQSAKPEAGY